MEQWSQCGPSEEAITLPVLLGAIWTSCPFPHRPCSGGKLRAPTAAVEEHQEWPMDLPEGQAAGPTAQSRCPPGGGGGSRGSGWEQQRCLGGQAGWAEAKDAGISVNCACHRSAPSSLWRATGDRRLHTQSHPHVIPLTLGETCALSPPSCCTSLPSTSVCLPPA